MKFKKLLISASAVAAGSGLLATVLTSCAKSSIDDDLKIKLNDDGKFIDELIQGKSLDFKAAAQKALKQSSTWKIFKENLAKEIVYKWYVNRAASKDHPNRNSNFKTFLQRKNYKVDDDYNSKVDSYKSKYGANHPFYIQNELLSPNGGTVENYKHAQLIDMVKDEFIDNVFTTSYFSMKDSKSTSTPGAQYPHIFSEAESSMVTTESLNNPDEWYRLGFWAKSNKNFTVKPEDDVDELAANPDGDYAIIQNYVFNRWFETEKPFFSSAALFNYHKPATVGKAMTDFYSNKTTVPDAPNEAFPFFGTATDSPSNGYIGQRAFWKWNEALENGIFLRRGLYHTKNEEQATVLNWNYTTSIPLDYSEDKQTLLLCYANNMIAGSNGTLYTPYAVAAASLYNQMLDIEESTPKFVPLNTITKTDFEKVLPTDEPLPDQEDPIILKLFYYDTKPAATSGIKSYLDLNNVYGGLNGTEYHCPLFVENKQFDFFYGDTITKKNGIRYITNNVQCNELAPTDPGVVQTDLAQPWVFELNESGMHAQTIDGYQYVRNAVTKASTLKYKHGRDALKEVLMYRLMQKKAGWDGGITSANVFGSKSGDLYDYFKNNFADIILEIALSQDKEVNVFRDIATYEDGIAVADKTKLFFVDICNGQKLYDKKEGQQDWTVVADYIEATRNADLKKSIFDNIVNSNKKIYAYRSTQVTNSKNDVGSNKVFENGLLAPMVATYEDDVTQRELYVLWYETTHHYADTIDFMIHPLYFDVEPANPENPVPTITGLYNKVEVNSAFDAFNIPFVNDIANVAKDSSSSGFSARIAKAKKAQSNRYWYESWIVDKTMYSFLDSNSLANEIKWTTYDLYTKNQELFPTFNLADDILPAADNEITSAYKAKKVLTSDNNFANLWSSPTTTADFYSTIKTAYSRLADTNKLNGGEYNDDYLSYKLFETTIAYLAKPDPEDPEHKPFVRFYNALEDTIKDGERAYIAYLTKYNTYDPFMGKTQKELPSSIANNPYKWDQNVANIYDYWHYTGNEAQTGGPETAPSLRGDFSSYWNVINKQFNGQTQATTLGGFLGIQTPSKNELDADSGLAGAAFGTGQYPFSHSVYQTQTVDTGKVVVENTGVWYPWAGEGIINGKTQKNEYYFDDIKVEDDPKRLKTIHFSDFANIPVAHKLAYKFVTYSNTEDLRALAGKVGKELHNQSNVFNDIATGQRHYDDPNKALIQMKYDVLNELLQTHIDEETGQEVYNYASAFDRLTNVELRRSMYDGWCFENQKNEGFKLMVTQINMADVHERHMSPKFENDTWVMDPKSPITEEEFWYILATFASDGKYQQDAMKDAIKTVFGSDKLKVYDAQLYNKFDSTWIKDWVKKPMGE